MSTFILATKGVANRPETTSFRLNATVFSVAFTLKNITNIYLIILIFGLIDYISLIRNLSRLK